MVGGLDDGSFLDVGDAPRDADEDAGFTYFFDGFGFFDESSDHFFGNIEVGDDAVFHGADGDDIARRTADHCVGFVTDGHDGLRVLIDGNDRWLPDDDTFALNIDDCICGT